MSYFLTRPTKHGGKKMKRIFTSLVVCFLTVFLTSSGSISGFISSKSSIDFAKSSEY